MGSAVLAWWSGRTERTITEKNQPRHGAENQRDENCPGDGHVRGTVAARIKQAKATR